MPAARSRWSSQAFITVAGVVLLAACSGGPSGTSPGGTASPPGSASPSGLGLSFSWPDGPKPVVTRTLAGIDASFVNPGAVIEHLGTLHMFANVFSAWPGHVDVPHLTSTDGVTWKLAEATPSLTSEDVPFAQPGADVSTGFVTEDGTWVLIFESVNAVARWEIGRATAPSPDGPWTVDPAPILTGGSAGSWDAGGLAWPSVVRTDGGYLMYFTGLDMPRGKGAIGLATSPDGVTWTKHEGPVLVADQAWELQKLDRPRVAVTPRGLVMVYAGGRLTDRGVAWSNDGVTWQKAGDAPTITRADFPISGNAWDAALLYRDGELTYFLEIGADSTTGTNVYRAVSSVP